MRKWFKYYLDETARGSAYIPIDKTFEQHADAMRSYDADESYESKEKFFDKYYFRYHLGRLEYYSDFLKSRLTRENDILSAGSGRCALELFLMEDGYRIRCSDLGTMGAYEATKKIFPNLDYIKLDILHDGIPGKYDAVIALSMLFLMDDEDLGLFLRNAYGCLNSGGHLIFDSAGSPDNLASFLMHDIYLRCEISMSRFLKFLKTGRLARITTKHFGFRRTDREIIAAAEAAGFRLCARREGGFVTDFRRSAVFNRIVKPDSGLERFFGALGRTMPYIRMFDFEKIS